jgi:hypothetical protein
MKMAGRGASGIPGKQAISDWAYFPGHGEFHVMFCLDGALPRSETGLAGTLGQRVHVMGGSKQHFDDNASDL